MDAHTVLVQFNGYMLFSDRHSTAEPEVREAEEVKFKEVSEAYSILIDIKKRRRYDTGQDLEDGMGFGMGKCVCVCVVPY